MDPRTILWQSLVTGVLLVALGLAIDPTTAAAVSGASLALAVALNLSYAHVLGSRGRPLQRIRDDHQVAALVGVAFAIPFAAGVAAKLLGKDPALGVWRFSAQEVTALALGLVCMFVLILLSSLVDWYYIRPRIDGIVWDPPCRTSGEDRWKRVTRRWYLHRGLASLSYSGFALLVSLIIMLMLVREDERAANVVGGVSGIATVLLIVVGDHWDQVKAVARFVLSPAFSVGDDLTYDTYRRRGRGFVLHVAVPVAKLVPLDDDGRRTAVTFVEAKNSDLAAGELSSIATEACQGGCTKLNDDCAVGQARLDACRRLLIV